MYNIECEGKVSSIISHFPLGSELYILYPDIMKIGLAGYSGSGVTTLLALLSEDVELAGRHAGPEIRSVVVEDQRLDQLDDFFKPKKVTPLQVEVVELGDLRPEEGGGLRKETLARSAGLDAMALVLRGFAAPLSPECRPSEELTGELESLMQEFAIADLLPVENRLEKLGKEGNLISREGQLLTRLKTGLEDGTPVRGMSLDKDEIRILAGYNFLTLVPLMVIANLGAECMDKVHYRGLDDRCSGEGINYLEMPGFSEFEILEIPVEERGPFLADLGILVPARKRFIEAVMAQLHLITFFTVSDREVRAWTVPEETPAAVAAGKIHTDMERGFIRAEVISVDDCINFGGLSGAREAGKLRVEGKDYRLKDGEILHVRFNV
jgi:ribosome-binding ATPase YchF (GTP1/OBG family)